MNQKGKWSFNSRKFPWLLLNVNFDKKKNLKKRKESTCTVTIINKVYVFILEFIET